MFYGNCGKLPDQCNVFAAAGAAYINECQVTSNIVGGGGKYENELVLKRLSVF